MDPEKAKEQDEVFNNGIVDIHGFFGALTDLNRYPYSLKSIAVSIGIVLAFFVVMGGITAVIYVIVKLA